MKKIRHIHVIVLLLSMSITCTYATNHSPVSIGHLFEHKQSTLLEVFKLIEDETGYVFFYSDEIKSELNVKVKPGTVDGSIQEILNPLLEKTSLTYQMNGTQVIVKRKETQTSFPAVTQKKVGTVTGTVVDETGEPLIGVNIWLKNSSTGTVTDIDGKFTIKVEGVGGVLTFTYVGMKSLEVAINNQSTINVTMQADDEVLEEVVVVGYGSQRKESVVGAISTIDVTQLKVPSASISNSLAGQLAGIVAMTRSGEPGKSSAADFYIRGVSSFKGSSKPLVLVDGIERDLDLVDTDDISSFSILKDASASAVYGVRGANGVILISTKKGNIGKPAINVRAEAGITSPTRMPKMINSAQWADLYNDIQPGFYTQKDIDMYESGADPDLYPNVNWIDALYDDMAANQRINLNINGGTDIVKYYVAGSFYNESSIFKDAGDLYDYRSSVNYNKFNFRANLDLSLTKSTVLNLNLANIYEKYFGPGANDNNGSIWQYTYLISPNAFPVQYSDGTISAPSTDSGYNPWNLLVHSGYRQQFWNSSQSLVGLTQDFGAIWQPLKGLTGNFKFSWDAWNTTLQRRSKEPTQYHATGRDEEGNLIYGNPIRTGSGELQYSISHSGTMTTYMEGSLNYSRLFNNKHRVGALFLYNHKIHVRTQEADKFRSLPYKNQGVAGRLTYGFNDTYFAEVNMGYNGSENFARGHRFGFFPAGAIGWMVSNEKWFKPLTKVIDMLKLKSSYGIVGNDDIGGQRRWVYESTILVGSDAGAGSWNYGSAGGNGGGGIRTGDVENLTASWEEAHKFNAGAEFSLFNKLRVQADYFYEKRTGIFLQRDGLPAIVGLSVIPYTNIGETKNQGFDGTMEYSQKVGNVFLTGRANFTYNRNELINNDQPNWEYKYQNRIGKPFGSGGSLQPFGLHALGLFESQEEIDNSPKQSFGEYRVGDIKYQDINGDGIINTQDYIAMGYTNMPEMIYGFGATAQWKSWDVNLFFQGVGHVSFQLNGSTIKSPFSSGNMERAAINEDIYNKVWRPGNTPEQNAHVIYPRLSWGGGAGSSNNLQTSDWWLQDGSFLRLKNFEVGYTMPKSLMSKTFIKSMRLYISGNNLLTFSKFKLWDPEKGNGDGSGYPPNRIVTFGLNINL
ncbi:TonB-dependent receptor [Parabacteroides sp. OttesenSCG-928-G06]|nr:TonB-dependent receptor [Parabacteroides sp. OttesenSCG-928-K15]MDL2282495.1 TonB-dependent receptor [Parabacteroides sp. OttesenSCG-928-G06]